MKRPNVTEAEYTPNGLRLKVDGYNTLVVSRPDLLTENIVIMLDSDQTALYFDTFYRAEWPGDPADNNAAATIRGGTIDPVPVAMYKVWFEHWNAKPSRLGSVTVLSRDEAFAYLDAE